jgi:hypothetical protein
MHRVAISAVYRSYGVHIVAPGLVVFQRPLTTWLGGIFVCFFAALGCIGMSRALADWGAPPSSRLKGALGVAIFGFFTVRGLLLLGPHKMTIDLAQGIYWGRAGPFGVSSFGGAVSDIDGLVMKGEPVRNHKIFRLYLVWKDPHRPGFLLATIPYREIARSAMQDVDSATGLPVLDEM